MSYKKVIALLLTASITTGNVAATAIAEPIEIEETTEDTSEELDEEEEEAEEDVNDTVIKNDMIKWDDAVLDYNGTDVCSISGTVTYIKDGDEARCAASGEATLDGADVGTHKIVSLSDVVFEDDTLTFDDTDAVYDSISITIKPIPVTVNAVEETIEYGSDQWKAIKEGTEGPDLNLSRLIAIDTEHVPEALADEASSIDLSAVTVHLTLPDGIGTNDDGVVLSVDEENIISGNFEISIGKSAALHVEQETSLNEASIWNMIMVSEDAKLDGTEGAYQNEDGIIYLKGGSSIPFSVTDDTKKEGLYDQVVFFDDGTDVGNHLSEEMLQHETVTVALKNSESGAMSKDYAIPSQKILSDTEIPSVSLTFDKEDQTDVEIANKKFKIFKNESATAMIEGKDAHSGVSKIEYAIMEPKSAVERIDDLPDFNTIDTWEELPEDGRVEVSTPKTAVIYIRITDHVGNVGYYVSKDGAILEEDAPTVSILLPETEYKTTDGVPLYDMGKITGKIKVSDEIGDVYSGLKVIDWEVNEENKGTFEEAGSANAEETFEMNLADDNAITLSAEAYDRSGNHTKETTTFAVDTTAPILNGSWDNEDVSNGSYFNKSRTFTLSIDDQNFVEDGLLFTVNGDTYLFSELNSVPGITTRKISETEYQISFGAEEEIDQTYEFAVEGTDLAGHTAVYEPTKDTDHTFTIDQISPSKPEILFYRDGELVTGISTNAERPSYFNTKLEASVSMMEQHMEGGSVEVALTRNGRRLAIDSLEDLSTWIHNGADHHHNGMIFDDGIYSLAIRVTDAAGNSSESATYHVVKDTNAPELSLYLDGEEYTANEFSTFVNFGLYKNSSINAHLVAADDTAGIRSISYVIAPQSSNQSLLVPSVSTLESWDWTDGDRFTITPNQQSLIYARAIDRAGNITYISSRHGIIAETTAPNVTITLPNAPGTTDGSLPLYAGNVDCTLSVNDASGSVHSGLRSVGWEVLNNGTITQSGQYPVSGRPQVFSETPTINAGLNNSNNVVIRVTATDYAGNTTVTERRLAIDTTAPKIEISFDKNDAKNGSYYNETRTATVRVTERNFNAALVNLNLRNTKDVAMGEWQTSGSGDQTIHTRTITFANDGDYQLAASLSDRAGNRSNQATTSAFTIDKTNPVISISSADARRYSNETRRIVVTVNEHNFNAALIEKTITAILDGQGIQAPSISAWTHNGDIHTAYIDFDQDGDFALRITGKDLAENQGNTVSQEVFTIDKTAPSIHFEHVSDGQSYRGDLKPLIRFSDRNILLRSTTFTLHRAGAEDVDVTSDLRKISETEGSLTLSDIKKLIANDGYYTLTVSARDRAGNITQETIHFRVNRFGSQYGMGGRTKERLDDYYVPAGSGLVFTEKNVNELKEYHVTLAVNGEVSELKEGDDYIISHEVDSEGWYQYTYRLRKTLLEQDGIYEVEIRSVDEAGNEQSNKLKNMPISFAVDETAPTVVLSGITNGDIINASKVDYTITVSDNLAMKEVIVSENGTEVVKLNQDEIKESAGIILRTLKKSNDWQSIDVTARDLAGNEFKMETVKVLLTENATVIETEEVKQKTQNNLPWIGGGALAVLAGVIAMLGWKKKRKEKKKD